MDLLAGDSKVYKLVGPVLLTVDQEEAKDNVAKRIQFIEKEIERLQVLTGIFSIPRIIIMLCIQS